MRTSNHLNSLGMCSVYCPEANFLPLGSEGKGKLYSLEVEHLESERASTILFTSLLQCSEYLWRGQKIISSLISLSCWLLEVFLEDYLV